MKVCVTGGRDYSDRETVYRVLDIVREQWGVTELVHGACPYGGADILAEDWAKDREITYTGVPALFKTDGRRAGPERNQHILDVHKPDVVVAFPGGRGTADMVRRAQVAGLTVVKG